MSTSESVVTGSATVTIKQPVGEVFAAIADVARMGEWSPECTGCRWVDGAEGPAIGAKFEGDNVASIGPITLKKWTTTSEVTDYALNETFEFVSADYTHWRYEFVENDGKTYVTESFSYPPYTGLQRGYDLFGSRKKTLTKGMQATLDRVKDRLER